MGPLRAPVRQLDVRRTACPSPRDRAGRVFSGEMSLLFDQSSYVSVVCSPPSRLPRRPGDELAAGGVARAVSSVKGPVHPAVVQRDRPVLLIMVVSASGNGAASIQCGATAADEPSPTRNSSAHDHRRGHSAAPAAMRARGVLIDCLSSRLIPIPHVPCHDRDRTKAAQPKRKTAQTAGDAIAVR